MKKNISLIAILLVSLFIFTGCANNNKEDKKDTAKEPVKTEEKDKAEDKKEETKEETSKKEPKPVKELGNKYVNLDKRSFAVNGKVYTLGVNTLQEMIDDGVPFDENDLQNANNNINKNSESQSFEIVLGKYYSAQVRVMNDSSENKKISECKLSQIYLPVNNDKEQDILSFAFPLTISEEELLKQAGEPSNKSEYKGDNDYVSNTYEYKIDSTKYYGNSGYTFQFTNGSLRYITISYKP